MERFLAFACGGVVDGVGVIGVCFLMGECAGRGVSDVCVSAESLLACVAGWCWRCGCLGSLVLGHPLLGAVVHLAGEREGWLFTGRLSLEGQPWLLITR